jgi:hypothetical protein
MEREQLENRRNEGESNCNSGDGTDQMVQNWMFMMMMVIKMMVMVVVVVMMMLLVMMMILIMMIMIIHTMYKHIWTTTIELIQL